MPLTKALRVVAELEGMVDSTDWEIRHREGEVADLSPYGLHHLAEHGIDIWWRGGRPGRARRRLNGALRARTANLAWSETLVPRRRPPWTPQVVLCWDERSGVPALARERLLPRHRPVATGLIWAGEPDADPAATRACARWLPRAALVWVLSTAQLPTARDLAGPGVRVEYLPFGVDVDLFSPGPARAPRPEPSDARLIVSVGNDRHRDHDGLVSSAAQVAGTRPEVRLELASRLPVQVPPALGRRHPHLGMRDLVPLYREAAVVAIATRTNTHASGITAVLEAMACGRPVVVSDTPGMSDYVTHGRTGLLVPVGDTDGFAAAIASLLDDPDRAEAIGAAARDHVVARHSSSTMQARLAQLLADL